MKKTPYILALLAGTSALLLSGCAKEMAISSDGASLNFSANSLEIVSTKAADEALTGTAAAANKTLSLYSDGKWSGMTLEAAEAVNSDGFSAATKAEEITELTTFTVAGFDATTGAKWFPQSAASQEVTPPETTYDAYKWKTGESYNFFGYANLPASSSVASAAITSEGVTLTYTAVPESATDQNDILLGASYSNDPSKGEAKMRFFHPLAEVVFKLGEISGADVKITGITLDGVYTSGTVTCNGNDEPTYCDPGCYKFNWEPGSTTGQVTQTIASGITESDGVIGVPFMLIPQDFTSIAPLTIIIDAKIGGAAKSFSATLDDASWYSGKKYTYTIKQKSGPNPEFWVDLGMVSEDGYPLWISKYNVKSVDNEGNVTFAEDSADDLTPITSTIFNSSFKHNGLSVRPLKAEEGFSMLFERNFEWTNSSDLSYSQATSKINGASIKFPRHETKARYLLNRELTRISSSGNNVSAIFLGDPLDNHEVSPQAILYNAADFNHTYTYLRLVYEDIGSPIIDCIRKQPARPFFISYASHNTLPYPIEDTPNYELIENESSYESSMYGELNFQVLTELTFSNGYRQVLDAVPGDQVWTLSDVSGNPSNVYELQGNLIMVKSDYGHNPSCKLTIVSPDGTMWFKLQGRTCFVKGTLITLADGSRKPVEDLTYEDELKVWNFDKGSFDTAKIFWLTKSGMMTDHYIKCTFSDGTVLCLTGDKSHHKVYNYTDRFFEGIADVEVGKEIFTENGVVTLVSKEWIDEPVENYNLMTEGHFNCFANGILTSVRLNNIYPIDENMKFIKDDRGRRPYSEFKAVGISREWYNGLRLSEQTDSLDYIKSKVDIFTEQMAEKPAPTFWQKLRTWWKSIFG